MEYVEKKSESNERHILQLDRRVTEVEKLGEDTSALWKQLGELQEYANNSRADLQSIRTYSFDLFSNTKKNSMRKELYDIFNNSFHFCGNIPKAKV